MTIQMKPRPDCTPDGAENDDLLEDARGKASHADNGRRKPVVPVRTQRPRTKVEGIQLTWRNDDERFACLKRWAAAMFCSRSLGVGELRLAHVIGLYGHSQTGGFWYSQETVAEAFDCAPRRVSEARSGLQKAGFLVSRWERSPGRPNDPKVLMFFPSLPPEEWTVLRPSLDEVAKARRDRERAEIPLSLNEGERAEIRSSGESGNTALRVGGNTAHDRRSIEERDRRDQERLQEEKEIQQQQESIEAWIFGEEEGQDQSLTNEPSSETDPKKGLPETEVHAPQSYSIEDDDDLAPPPTKDTSPIGRRATGSVDDAFRDLLDIVGSGSWTRGVLIKKAMGDEFIRWAHVLAEQGLTERDLSTLQHRARELEGASA